ncbi:hypothetical protein C1645_833643 [Glomus cerebriforme]|uniref:Uncharacterized protein n=1 Tax=Glomus cerebriforme TaxID=658196 RepID=A0A397SH78_9GLOM|nr:hypothetical protein C1645_833643 [Glomus cerebriforme]
MGEGSSNDSSFVGLSVFGLILESSPSSLVQTGKEKWFSELFSPEWEGKTVSSLYFQFDIESETYMKLGTTLLQFGHLKLGNGSWILFQNQAFFQFWLENLKYSNKWFFFFCRFNSGNSGLETFNSGNSRLETFNSGNSGLETFNSGNSRLETFAPGFWKLKHKFCNFAPGLGKLKRKFRNVCSWTWETETFSSGNRNGNISFVMFAPRLEKLKHKFYLVCSLKFGFLVIRNKSNSKTELGFYGIDSKNNNYLSDDKINICIIEAFAEVNDEKSKDDKVNNSRTSNNNKRSEEDDYNYDIDNVLGIDNDDNYDENYEQ